MELQLDSKDNNSLGIWKKGHYFQCHPTISYTFPPSIRLTWFPLVKIGALQITNLFKDLSVEVFKHSINLTHGLSQGDIKTNMK